MNEEKCCVVSCESPLDQTYWNTQYDAKKLGWDLGQVAPPLKEYIDTIENKAIAILIPGCGNAYEAQYLLDNGFTNITVVDIAPTLVQMLQEKFKNNPNITIVLGDFFEHNAVYDLIIEQTFFCAIPPFLRQRYVWKMHQLLAQNGILAGLLFNRDFNEGPPFGGHRDEYEGLFKDAFIFKSLAEAENSVASRTGSELFIEFQKDNTNLVNLYHFEGITCSGCKATVAQKYLELESVLNVSMNTNFSELLLVSNSEVDVNDLQKIVSYDDDYKIAEFKF